MNVSNRYWRRLFKTAASLAAQVMGGWTLDMIRAKTGHGGRWDEDFPFVALCGVAGLVAIGFLAVVFYDAYKQWRARAPLRAALKDAKRRAKLAGQEAREPLARSKP